MDRPRFAPDALGFPPAPVGQRALAAALLRAGGGGPYWELEMAVSGDFALIGERRAILSANRGSLCIPLSFEPTAVGAARGELRCALTDAAGATETLCCPLSGEGLDPRQPRIRGAPRSLDLGRVPLGSESAAPLLLENPAHPEAGPFECELSVSGDGFRVEPEGSRTIEDGGRLGVRVCWRPRDEGASAGELRVLGRRGGDRHHWTISLIGWAAPAPRSAPPAEGRP